MSKVKESADKPFVVGDGTPGPGRKKGVPNKTTTQLKMMILQALDNAGGVDYLTERANDERTRGAFLALLGKVLPMQVTGEDGGPLQATVTVKFVQPEKKE